MTSCERPPALCPWCHHPAQIVWVHGHGQCAHCRINIEPCCSGDETAPTGPDETAERP